MVRTLVTSQGERDGMWFYADKTARNLTLFLVHVDREGLFSSL